MGQALRLPRLFWKKAGLRRSVGVAHLLGRHEAGRREHVGKIRPVEPEGPQWEPWWCHLFPV